MDCGLIVEQDVLLIEEIAERMDRHFRQILRYTLQPAANPSVMLIW